MKSSRRLRMRIDGYKVWGKAVFVSNKNGAIYTWYWRGKDGWQLEDIDTGKGDYEPLTTEEIVTQLDLLTANNPTLLRRTQDMISVLESIKQNDDIDDILSVVDDVKSQLIDLYALLTKAEPEHSLKHTQNGRGEGFFNRGGKNVQR